MKKYLVILLLLIACPAWGATYYVRADGTVTAANKALATSPETANTALSRPQVNAATFSPGDYVLFSSQGGVYATSAAGLVIPSSGDVGGRITYANVPGESPVLQGTITSTISIAAKSYVNIGGFIINNQATNDYSNAISITGTTDNINIYDIAATMSSEQPHRYIITSSGNSSNVEIDNITSTGASGKDIYFYGTTNSSISLSNVTTSGLGVKIANTDNVTIEDIVANNTGDTAVELVSCSGTLNVDTITSTSSIYGGLSFTSCAFSDGVVSNSIVTDSGTSAFYAINSSGITFNNCESINSGGYAFFNDEGSHDITYNHCTGDNSAYAVYWVEDDAYNITYNYCTAVNGSGDGFGVMNSAHDITYNHCQASYNGDITTTSEGDGFTAHLTNYNIFYYYCVSHHNTAAGFGFGGNSSGIVYNSISYANGGDWTSEGGVTQVRSGFYLPLAGVNPTTGASWTLKNNISYGNYPAELYANTYPTYDYNIYYPLDNSKLVNNGNGTYTSWDDYHAAHEEHSINSDPKFISSTNFHLQSDSPARGAGVNVGLSNTNPPDIGAEPYKQYVPWMK